MRARGMGAHVIVTEVDPVRALEALMDGYEVLPMERAAEIGDLFCTATGDKNVIGRDALERLKDGAILSNTGYFNVEIDIPALRELAVAERELTPERRGVRVGGRPPRLSDRRGPPRQPRGSRGHPASVMDMSFANQALSAEHVVAHTAELEPRVYGVPEEIDREIARLKL